MLLFVTTVRPGWYNGRQHQHTIVTAAVFCQVPQTAALAKVKVKLGYIAL